MFINLTQIHFYCFFLSFIISAAVLNKTFGYGYKDIFFINLLTIVIVYVLSLFMLSWVAFVFKTNLVDIFNYS